MNSQRVNLLSNPFQTPNADTTPEALARVEDSPATRLPLVQQIGIPILSCLIGYAGLQVVYSSINRSDWIRDSILCFQGHACLLLLFGLVNLILQVTDGPRRIAQPWFQRLKLLVFSWAGIAVGLTGQFLPEYLSTGMPIEALTFMERVIGTIWGVQGRVIAWLACGTMLVPPMLLAIRQAVINSNRQQEFGSRFLNLSLIVLGILGAKIVAGALLSTPWMLW